MNSLNENFEMQAADLKLETNAAYTDGQSSMYPQIERLKTKNLAMQARIDELEYENSILHQAAATHLRNQHHYYDLYHNLISQLYPYAVDLADQENSSNSEFEAGYNRSRECASVNLLEMMESDIEYIKAYCVGDE